MKKKPQMSAWLVVYLHPLRNTAKCTAMSHSGRTEDIVLVTRRLLQHEHEGFSPDVALLRMPRWLALDRKLAWQRPVEPTPAEFIDHPGSTLEEMAANRLHSSWRYLKSEADYKNQKAVRYTRAQGAWASAGA